MSCRSIGFAYSNVPVGADSLCPSRVYFQDATIYLGEYIAMLALEYSNLNSVSTLNNNSQKIGENKIATLNELYFALAALNRLDDFAEFYLSQGNSEFSNPQRNGLLLRDDVLPFFHQNFQSDFSIPFNRPADLDYTDCDFRPIDEYDGGAASVFNDGNVMSLDQIATILLGLRSVYNLVGDVTVQPTESDTPMNLRDEARNIIFRIIDQCTHEVDNCENCLAFNVRANNKLVKSGPDLTYAAPSLIQLAIDLGHPRFTQMQADGSLENLRVVFQVHNTDFIYDLKLKLLDLLESGVDAEIFLLAQLGINASQSAFVQFVNELIYQLDQILVDQRPLSIGKIDFWALRFLMGQVGEQNMDISVNGDPCIHFTPEVIQALSTITFGLIEYDLLSWIGNNRIFNILKHAQHTAMLTRLLSLPGVGETALGISTFVCTNILIQMIQNHSGTVCLQSYFDNINAELNVLYAPYNYVNNLSNNSTDLVSDLGVRLNDDNVHIMLEMATLSGTWSREFVSTVSMNSNMEWYPMLYDVLHGESQLSQAPSASHILEKYLNSAPCEGPWAIPSQGQLGVSTILQPTAGWKGNNRLFHPGNSEGIPDAGMRGEFSGLDFMMYYNLYQALHSDIAYERTISCHCVNEITELNQVENEITVLPKFEDYKSKSIPIESYLAHSVNLSSSIHVNNDLVLCRKDEEFPTVLTCKPLSKLELLNGNRLTINPGNKLVCEELSLFCTTFSNEIEYKPTEIVFEANSVLELQNGSVLDIRDGTNLYFKDGAKLRIEDLARISVDNTSAIHFENGAQWWFHRIERLGC
jgi:hypothetical protein